MIVAPSTAVRPAIASTARFRSSGSAFFVPHQLRQLGVRRIDGVEHRRDDRFAPGVRARRHDQQRAAAAVLPHRRRQLDQHRGHARRRLVIDRAGQRRRPRRAVGNHPADAFVDDLDLIAFEHRDVDELAERLGAMLDDDQSRRDHFDDQAERRALRASCPRRKSRRRPPHAEMNAGPLDRGRHLRQHRRRERQPRREQQRMPRLLGRQERERDLRRLSFFAAQAGPERGVDDRRDRAAAAACRAIDGAIRRRAPRRCAARSAPAPRRRQVWRRGRWAGSSIDWMLTKSDRAPTILS